MEEQNLVMIEHQQKWECASTPWDGRLRPIGLSLKCLKCELVTYNKSWCSTTADNLCWQNMPKSLDDVISTESGIRGTYMV